MQAIEFSAWASRPPRLPKGLGFGVIRSHLRSPGLCEARSGFNNALQMARTFLFSSLASRARIATTPATVRPAHVAVIVEVARDVSVGSCDYNHDVTPTILSSYRQPPRAFIDLPISQT